MPSSSVRLPGYTKKGAVLQWPGRNEQNFTKEFGYPSQHYQSFTRKRQNIHLDLFLKKNLFFFFFFSFEGEGIDREEDIKKYCEVIAIDEFGEWYMEVHDIIFTSFLSF